MVTELLGCKADRNTPSEATVLIVSSFGGGGGGGGRVGHGGVDGPSAQLRLRRSAGVHGAHGAAGGGASEPTEST